VAITPITTSTSAAPAATPGPVDVRRQDLRREVNDHIAGLSSRSTPTFEIVCECGRDGCGDYLTLDGETYAGLRRFPTHFVVKPGHQGGDDRLVEQLEGLLIVEKFGRDGVAAVQLDRRRRTSA
jgi:hypothetical protein